MSIAKIVQKKILSMKSNTIITLKSFPNIENKSTVNLKLCRMTSDGLLKRLSKGKYYKPKKTNFGYIAPVEKTIIYSLFNKNESYTSGISLYNGMGLTTQVSSTIFITSNKPAKKIKIGYLNIKSIKSKVKINKKNIFLLQILDILQNIKKIPDATVSEVLNKMSKKISTLTKTETKDFIKYSQSYRPFVRALVGMILEKQKFKDINKIKNKLNPITVFKLPVDEKIFFNKKEWNFI